MLPRAAHRSPTALAAASCALALATGCAPSQPRPAPPVAASVSAPLDSSCSLTAIASELRLPPTAGPVAELAASEHAVAWTTRPARDGSTRALVAWAGSGGEAGGSLDLASVLRGVQITRPRLAESGGVLAIAAQVYAPDQRSDVELVATPLGAGSSPTAPLHLRGSSFAGEPVLAAAPGGRFGVAWQHGAYPFTPDLSFAVVDAAGGAPARVVAERVLGRGVSARGVAIAWTGGGWLVVYATGSDQPRSKAPDFVPELVAAALGPDGELRMQRTLLRGWVTSPVAAWDGARLQLAFAWDARKLGLLRLRADGEPDAAPIVARDDPDPLLTLTPTSIVRRYDRTFIGTSADVYDGARIGEPARAMVIVVRDGDTAGRTTLLPCWPAAAPTDEAGCAAREPLLLPTPRGVRGVVESDGEPRGFALACDRAAAPAPPPSECDAVSRPLPESDHLRAPFDAVAFGDDLVVATASAKSPVLARVSASGDVRWSAPLPAGALERTALAGRGSEVAAVFDADGALGFGRWNADTGAELERRPLAPGRGWGMRCMSATPEGYLLVRSREATSIGVGSTDRALALPHEGERCAVARTARGFALVFASRVGFVGGGWMELSAARLDPSGAPVPSSERSLRGGASVFTPIPIALLDPRQLRVVALGDRALVTWVGPHARRLYGMKLGPDLDATGPPRLLASTFGISGYALAAPAPTPRVIWATAAGTGSRPWCE